MERSDMSIISKKRKMLVYGIIIIVGFYFISGIIYSRFCKDKIEVRQQHLVSVSRALIPPQNAIKFQESFLEKAFSVFYYVDYKYDKSTETVLKYYSTKLEEQGYIIEKIGRNSIEGKKDSIIVKIKYLDNTIFIVIKFDEILTRLYL